jgi:prepilin-type N-terminal cleavage/methylation domain-containing protein
MIRRTASQTRSAFTLIELLIAIAIIALLLALLLPAVSKVRTFANRATATSEMNQLAAATTKFQGDWGFYPPSSFIIPSNVVTHAASVQLLKSKYVRWNPTTDMAGNIIAPSVLAGAGTVLNGNQSLVYFLGGPAGTGWAADGPYAPSVSSTTSMQYFAFPPAKLVAGTTYSYSGANVYLDPFGSPYAYFGSNKVGGKYNLTDSMAFNGTTIYPVMESATKFVNEKTCQIICAGENGPDDSLPTGSRGFGAGGVWVPGTGTYASSSSGGDDFGNFNGGAPMNRRGD